LLPEFDNSDELAIVVEADQPTTWQALIDTDLMEVGRKHPVSAALGAARILPELIVGLVHGDTPEPPPDSMKLGEMADPRSGAGTWVKLGERTGSELALGLVGKFWKPLIDYRSVAAEDFSSFSEPGFAKTIYAFRLQPAGEGRTLVTAVMRTATTDEHARKWFRRYWTYGVGSGAHILVNGLLDVVRDAAEDAAGAR
jgi:hypothetical protein